MAGDPYNNSGGSKQPMEGGRQRRELRTEPKNSLEAQEHRLGTARPDYPSDSAGTAEDPYRHCQTN